MADSDAGTGGSGTGKVRLDEIVAHVIADPASAQGATLLSGFVGKSDAEGRVRIYPDTSFSSWQDVAEADILHSVPLPPESSPLGGSYVWVKRGAAIKQGPAPVPSGAAAAFPAGAAEGLPFSIAPTCGFACTYVPPCPPPPPPCTVPSTLCPTVDVPTCPPPPPPCTVPSTLCPTVDVQTCPPNCQPTMVGPTCPNCEPTMVGPTCPNGDCPAGAAAGIATFHGSTCPRNICTETIPPTATYFYTCGTQCASGVLTVVCTYAGCHQGWTVAQPTTTFNPTLCTQCFVCPPVTAPQTRSGVFCPFGA